MADFTVSTDVDNFLQSADNAAARTSLGLNLDSITTNGATTKNNIQVGTIATLHPTNTANDNAATGSQSASIGGRRNTASATRATTFGGLSNTVSGQDSTAVGGNNQSVIGVESEGVGSTNLKLFSKYTSAVGAANSTIGTLNGVAPNPEDLYADDPAAKHSIILGGENIEIQHAEYAATVGGDANTVETGHHRSVILGGANITSDAADTAYVQNLNIKSAVKMRNLSIRTLSGTTSNNTQTEIFVDGVALERATIATNTTWMFSAMVAARSATESAGYKIEGVIKNDAGTTSLVGVAVKTVFAEEDIAWDITVEADDTNDALVFKVTGDSADSVSWEVTLNKTEAA